MAEFATRLPSKYWEELFGRTDFYETNKRSDRDIQKFRAKLGKLLEHPEFRDIWNTARDEPDENMIVRALGRFARNKPGRKVK